MLSAAVLLAACATNPGHQPADSAIQIPAGWSAAPVGTDADSLAGWWMRLGDQSLSQLVAEALAGNTTVRSAQAAVRQARATLDVTRASAGPSLSASGSAQRSKSGDNPAGNRFQAGFDASWEPDLFGGNARGVDASLADARAAETSLADARVSLAAEVAVTYIELRGLQQRLAIARRNLALQQETLQITRWRVQAGLASSLDLEQSVAANEQTQAQIPALQASVAQSIHALSVLTGQPPAQLQARLDAAAAIPQAPDALALALPADTLRQRPDVRTAALRVEAALARRAQAEAARYPSLRLSGSIGLSALTLSGLGSGATVANALLGSLSAPLFDGGAARARVEAQDAALEQSRIAYQAAVLGALRDVEDALVSLRGNRERLARLQAAAEAAANAELLARQRYGSGLIDFRSVLDTQRTLLSAQDSVASVQASLSADHVRLYKALGGGWQPEPPVDDR
jgi:outer membrane protein, multidrug efflux system